MLLDFLSVNYFNIYLVSIIIFIFIINDKLMYYILLLDLIVNGIPFISMIIIILYYLNKSILKRINACFINKYILSIIYYFLFSIILYSIFNKFNLYIIKYLINNLPLNLIYYYISLKIIDRKNEIYE
mgnify:FL=1